ncbi:tyrosinase family protein [Streptomyces sp. CBMA152]|uniref:tyrosinase family protein n=1 Tax=Streptomyces sp. CBMA152 TaxID=1896312 RepID=UPI001660E58E|nr:tyrosinase family protein [Streptomyces sp. CBMA152]
MQAVFQLKSSGIVDSFAQLHSRIFHQGIHQTSHFLPWHREFLLRFERELQRIDPTVSIPYWNSSVDNKVDDPLWSDAFLGQFDTQWNLHRMLGVGGLPTPKQVEANQELGTYDEFWPDLEQNIHNPPHSWVGGVMSGFTSPGDPAFYLHHSWIDLLWVRWQRGHPEAPFVSSGPGFGLTDPMREFSGRTPADVLDHRALGYRYDEFEGPWNDPIADVAPNPGSADLNSGIAAVSATPGLAEAFWIGQGRNAGVLFTNARNANGTWNNPIANVAPNPGSADPNGGIAAVSTAPGLVDVFWIRSDGIIFTNARNPDGTWNNPIADVAPNPGSVEPNGGIAAVSTRPGLVEVFWIRSDGIVFTNARNANGTWNNPIANVAPNPGSADPNGGIAAVSTAPGLVDVFWIGQGENAGIVFTNARNPDGTWNNPIADVAPNLGSADPNGGIAAVSTRPGLVDVFWVGQGENAGVVFTNARNPDGTWNDPIADVAPNPGSADPNGGIAAVSTVSGLVDVFWARHDGKLFTNARNPDGTWNNPIADVAPIPGSADPNGGIAAVSTAPGLVDVFWIGQGQNTGIVFTNARNPS